MNEPVSEIKKLIVLRNQTPFFPFEPIEASLNYRAANFEKKIDSFLSMGYPMRPAYLFKLDQPLPWHHNDRTVAYNLQAFEPISSLLMAYSMTKRQDYFKLAVSYLNDWLKYVRPPSQKEMDGEWEETQEKDFLWYNMAVGLRCYRLAYIIDNLMRSETLDDSQISYLLEILEWHRQFIMREETFLKHNNHGLYQALGQIAMARRFQDLPSMKEALVQGEERLNRMLKQQFFQSGVHREHSPGYHWMILRTLCEAMYVGLIQDSNQKQLIDKAQEVMSWFITPNMKLTAFGDTNAGDIESGSYEAKDFSHPHLRFMLSQGKYGSPAVEYLKVYQDAGYGLFRYYTPQSNTKWTYLAQHAGFNSITHKHSDHLTFVWFDKDEEILVDAGRYGYNGRTAKGSELRKQGFWYSDLKRIYVEKTRAHNTVEIDGMDFPRRKTRIFGSAIRRTANTDNHVYAIETECRHFRTIRHARILFVCPGQFLIVFDWLKDSTNALHDFRQWFHLGAALDLVSENETLSIIRKGEPFASVTSLLPHISLETLARGQMEPDLNGWVSHDKGGLLLPNWAFAYSICQSTQATFATLFSLTPEIQLWKESRVSLSGQAGQFTWRSPTEYHTLSFLRHPKEDFSLHYHYKQKEEKETNTNENKVPN